MGGRGEGRGGIEFIPIGDKSPSYARNLKTGAAYMLRMMKEPFRGKDHEVAVALPPETTTGDKRRVHKKMNC